MAWNSWRSQYQSKIRQRQLANNTLDVEVDSATNLSITAEYLFSDSLGLELLASLPFKHDITLNSADAGDVTHLPPTLSLQYHFMPEAILSPYVGLGINFTYIFSEDSAGPIAGTDLNLKNSLGLAAHAGVDYKFSDTWFAGIDARWMDIDADVTVNGTDVGTANIDPLILGAYIGKSM
jgi:outer membrane protein